MVKAGKCKIGGKAGWGFPVLRFPLGAVLLSGIFVLEINVSYGTPGTSQQQRSSTVTSSVSSDDFKDKDGAQSDACPSREAWCSSLDDIEKLALEAIRSLHHQLDDDKNGNIDLAESDEFLREELKYEKNIENRQKAFHRDDDNQVSVRELWETWVKSEVHNWTTEQTAEWLSSSAGLPKHRDKFLQRNVNGTVLPILAVNHNNFLTTVLGIKDSITKQKVAVKAMDVVLFGPPRYTNNYVKDVILTSLLALALIACYTVYKRYQASQEDLSKMAKDMAELYKAEKELQTMQDELEKARTDQQLREQQSIIQQSSIDGDDPEELLKLREENMVLRNELHRAEVELQDKCWVSPPALQHWLQFTYELELRAYNKKRTGAERQLKQAKDACEKLKKKRTSLMGAFVSTHGRSIDDVDKAILEAKTALTEITHELQERSNRWKQIELLVGCPVMSNPGLGYLENLLRVYGKAHLFSGPGSVVSNSQDDIDDDGASSIYCPSAVHKLISTSTFLMFPGPQIPFQHQHSSASSRLVNFKSYAVDPLAAVNGPMFEGIINSFSSRTTYRKTENWPKESLADINSILQNVTCQCSERAGMIESGDTGPGFTSNFGIGRSKSINSMARASRDTSSKESSNGEDEAQAEGSDAQSSARDKRVTFRSDRRRLLAEKLNSKSLSGNSTEDTESSCKADLVYPTKLIEKPPRRHVSKPPETSSKPVPISLVEKEQGEGDAPSLTVSANLRNVLKESQLKGTEGEVHDCTSEKKMHRQSMGPTVLSMNNESNEVIHRTRSLINVPLSSEPGQKTVEIKNGGGKTGKKRTWRMSLVSAVRKLGTDNKKVHPTQ